MTPASRTVVLPGPYDLLGSLMTLRRGPGDPALRVIGAEIWRATRTPEGTATMRLRMRGADRVEVLAWGAGAGWAIDQAPDLLGAADRPEDFRPAQPWLADLHRRERDLRLPRTARVMEALIPAVLEQKVLGIDAFAAWRRLPQRHGDPAPGPAPSTLIVPPSSPTWARLTAAHWHAAGVTPQRYRTAQAVARIGDRLEQLPEDRLARALLQIPGVGRWTVAETVARAHGDADAVPWGDYHLGRVVGMAFLGTVIDDEAQIAALLAPFAPHRYRVWRLLSRHTAVPRRGPRRPRVDVRRF